MIRKPAVIAFLLTGAVSYAAQDKGYCPPAPSPHYTAPSKNGAPPPPSTPDKKYFGTVTLLTVVSDKGYVCSTQVLKGINKEIDKNAEESARQWRFTPATKGNRTVPVVITVKVNFWSTSTGEIVSDPPPSSAQSKDSKRTG